MFCCHCQNKVEYFCYCQARVCSNHLGLHGQSCSNFFVRKIDVSDKAKILATELYSRIEKINYIHSEIVKKSYELIKKIENLCAANIKKLEVLKKKYAAILEKGDICEIENELKKEVFENDNIKLDINDIEEFYCKDYYFEKAVSKKHIEFINAVQAIDYIKKEYDFAIENINGNVWSVAISNDKKYAATGGEDKVVKLWNLIEKRKETELKGHKDYVNTVAITHNGKHVVSSGCDRIIIVWSIKKKNIKFACKGHDSYVNIVFTTYDNKYIISGGGDCSVRLWDFKKRCQDTVLNYHHKPIHTLSVTYNNQYAISGGMDSDLIVWNIENKCIKLVLKGHEGPIWSLTFTYDDKFVVSGSDDNTVRIWDHSTGYRVAVLKKDNDDHNIVKEYSEIKLFLMILV